MWRLQAPCYEARQLVQALSEEVVSAVEPDEALKNSGRTAFKALFSAQVAGALASAASVKSIHHSGLKGQMREILIRQLFRPLLPPNIGIGQGIVVSSHDQPQSKQTDIVLYEKAHVPAVLVDDDNGIFPIDATLYVIEVKSRLDAKAVSDSVKAAEQVSQLAFIPQPGPIQGPVACIFALESDLVGSNDLDRLVETENAIFPGKPEPIIRMLCVADKGCWAWLGAEGWMFVPASPDHSEVLYFLSCILNHYQAVADTRTVRNLHDYFKPRAVKHGTIGTMG